MLQPGTKEPCCKDCRWLSRDVQFEEWDCGHPKRPRGKSAAQPRDPAAPEWCPLRNQKVPQQRPAGPGPGRVDTGRSARLEDLLNYLREASADLELARDAAKDTQLPHIATLVDYYRMRIRDLGRELENAADKDEL